MTDKYILREVIKMSKEEKSFQKTSINCAIRIYGNTLTNPYK